MVVVDSRTTECEGTRDPDRIAPRSHRHPGHPCPGPPQPDLPDGIRLMPGKAVADKLLLRPGGRAWVSDPARAGLLVPLPDGAWIVPSPAGSDVAVVVVESAADVRSALSTYGAAL